MKIHHIYLKAFEKENYFKKDENTVGADVKFL